MKKIKVYFASGMDTMKDLVSVANLIKNTLKDKVEIYVPKLAIYTFEDAYVWSDIARLKASDILVLHIPKPTIGASSEMALFSYMKPHNLSIGYKCMKHGWIKELVKYQTSSDKVVLKIISDYIDLIQENIKE